MTRKALLRATYERSRDVLRDCALENGAIVAANTDKPYTPRSATDYRSVWPRDAAFVCLAAISLGMPEIVDRFLLWLEEKPEGFYKEKLLYQKYSTNGRRQGWQFQPDQMGIVLCLISWYTSGDRNKAERFSPLITRLADGLHSAWNGRFFSRHVTDLWEQEHLHTTWTMENNYTYTLAACSKGLFVAHSLFPNESWKSAATEMAEAIDRAYSETAGHFLRNHGKVDDANIDASLLGLAWPFAVCKPADPRMKKTVDAIERTLVRNGGVHRFQFDYYDGEGSAQEGGGAWPVLNFWMAIVLQTAGKSKKAREYFFWVIDRVHSEAEKYNGSTPSPGATPCLSSRHILLA